MPFSETIIPPRPILPPPLPPGEARRDKRGQKNYAGGAAMKGRVAFILLVKMSTFGIHRLDWLMVSKMFSWNAKYETIYGWFASFIVTYTIMELKS
jgi:hypothetical protein